MNFVTIEVDKCIYIKREVNSIIILVVYVDDLIVSTDSEKAFNKFKTDLGSDFKSNDLGHLHYCIGIEFFHNPETKSVEMSQQKYIYEVFEWNKDSWIEILENW